MTGIFIGVGGLVLLIFAARSIITSKRKRSDAVDAGDYTHGMELDLREISNALGQHTDINAFIALTYVQMSAIAFSWSREGWTLEAFENTVEEVTDTLARKIRTHYFLDIGSVVRDMSQDLAEDPIGSSYWTKLLVVEVTGKADIGLPECGPTAFDTEEFFECWNEHFTEFGATTLEIPHELAKASDDLMANTRTTMAAQLQN